MKSTVSGYWAEIQQNTKQGAESTEIWSREKRDKQICTEIETWTEVKQTKGEQYEKLC